MASWNVPILKQASLCKTYSTQQDHDTFGYIFNIIAPGQSQLDIDEVIWQVNGWHTSKLKGFLLFLFWKHRDDQVLLPK